MMLAFCIQKLTAKESGVCVVCRIPGTKNHYTKVLPFLKIENHTSLYDPTSSGATVDPTSQVCLSALLVLLIAEN
jgi:hypothetical protein